LKKGACGLLFLWRRAKNGSLPFQPFYFLTEIALNVTKFVRVPNETAKFCHFCCTATINIEVKWSGTVLAIG
jgi:hypothetical protein